MTTKAEILRAIRAKCLDCCCDVPSEVARCGAKSCSLHALRAGKDPTPARSGPAMPFGKNARPGGADLVEGS
jgi:hypothetical protein